MDQIRDQVTGEVVVAMDQTPHDLGHEFTASEYESTYPIQSTSDMVMEPDNGSPLTQDPEHILHHVSGEDDIVSWVNGGRTPSQLRTSPGRMTPSDEGFGPECMELQKSADGKTSPILSELQTLLGPELNNAAPSQSSNAIGPSRVSKRKTKGNERAENKRLKGVPLYAHELTDDEEFNKSILKAQTTKRHHDEKKRREEELKSRVEELASQLEESQKEKTDLKSEIITLKSENITLKSQLAQFNSHHSWDA